MRWWGKDRIFYATFHFFPCSVYLIVRVGASGMLGNHPEKVISEVALKGKIIKIWLQLLWWYIYSFINIRRQK